MGLGATDRRRLARANRPAPALRVDLDARASRAEHFHRVHGSATRSHRGQREPGAFDLLSRAIGVRLRTRLLPPRRSPRPRPPPAAAAVEPRAARAPRLRGHDRRRAARYAAQLVSEQPGPENPKPTPRD